MQRPTTQYTPLPVCPYCGHPKKNWWDGTALKSDGDTEIRTCDNCDREYEIEFIIETSFNAYKVDEVKE